MNLVTYFILILGGFGVVWGFRAIRYWGIEKKPISEFEYAAFSAIFGSLLMLLVLPAFNTTPGLLDTLQVEPFIATPAVFAFGCAIGILGAWSLILLRTFINWIR